MEHLIKTLDYVRRHRVIVAVGLIAMCVVGVVTLKLAITRFADDYNVPAVQLPDEPVLGAYGASLIASLLVFAAFIWLGGLLDREAKRGAAWVQRFHRERV